MQIIITDLTRFGPKTPKVCTAGVTEDGQVIRPMPYLTTDICHELDIHPGGILEGDFTFQNSDRPHIEDAFHKNLKFLGPCSKSDFRNALEMTLSESLSDGFGVEIREDKCIPLTTPPERSLVTIKVSPLTFSIVQSSFKDGPKKIKAHLSDGHGARLSYLSITDLGFFEFAEQHKNDPSRFAEINRFIQSQEELYLRLGVGRVHEATDGRHGYWIQLNGIYTFPNKLDYIRVYE